MAGATLAPDPALGRLERIGPAGLWYACLLVWGWLLLLFAADVPAQVAGALWLVAGLPLARRAYRRRLRAWGRRGRPAGILSPAPSASVPPPTPGWSSWSA